MNISDAGWICDAENLIGNGGSSTVYKGYLSDGKELAVKILKPSEVAVKEFVSEIEIITALHHKNIIPLLGFCMENNSLMLVYEYVSQGNLEEILHGMHFTPMNCFLFLLFICLAFSKVMYLSNYWYVR